ncbi:MAG: O-succinylbenzoate synthase [bacterium]|nr:O-succinylbenzoate synthase [bacterium]
MGEASPLPGYSPDEVSDARRALEAWGRGPLPSLELSGDCLEPVGAEVARLPSSAPAARFALETALLDLLGRRLGLPLYRLLGAPELPPAVPLAGLVPRLEPLPAALRAAAELWERGIRTLKVKVGAAGRFDAECRALRALRERFGERLALRLDANGALPRAEVEERLSALAASSPELIEEPLSGDDLLDLLNPPIPVALDESLRGEGAWERFEPWFERGRCTAVVLKPALLGGSLACLALARRAHARGLRCIASHLFDGPVALQATAAMALALPGEVPACGLARHAGLDAWPGAPPPLVGESALEPAAALPGLGLSGS